MLNFLGKVCGVAIGISVTFLLMVIGCYVIDAIVDFLTANYARLAIAMIIAIILLNKYCKKLMN